nr:hypothetical protein [Tanacetum cinerariifolium]
MPYTIARAICMHDYDMLPPGHGEAQKEDNEIWTIVENLDKQVKFCLDDDNVLWQDT